MQFMQTFLLGQANHGMKFILINYPFSLSILPFNGTLLHKVFLAAKEDRQKKWKNILLQIKVKKRKYNITPWNEEVCYHLQSKIKIRKYKKIRRTK